MKKFLCIQSSRSPSADPSLTRSRTTTTVRNNQSDKSRRPHSMNNGRSTWYSGECWDPQKIICVRWKVPNRYQDLTYVGHGAFGVVMRATDTKLNRTVAIKMLPRPSSRETNYKRIYREIKYLSYLSSSESEVVQLYNIFTPELSFDKFNTVYLVLDFFDSDLSKRIRSIKSKGQIFSENDVRHIIHSILRALKLLHSAGIIHRDIKPDNIGITDNDNVGLLDFGLARAGLDGLKTGYVVTRCWRAPEVMLNWERYNEKIDIWSVGCVMAELLLLTQLFPANSHEEHFKQIIELVEIPDGETLKKTCDPALVQLVLSHKRNALRKDFRQLFPRLSPEGIDFLQGLLRFDFQQRLTAEQALGHPFLSANRHEQSEVTTRVLHDRYRNTNYSSTEWKALIWNLVQNFREPTIRDDRKIGEY